MEEYKNSFLSKSGARLRLRDNLLGVIAMTLSDAEKRHGVMPADARDKLLPLVASEDERVLSGVILLLHGARYSSWAGFKRGLEGIASLKDEEPYGGH